MRLLCLITFFFSLISAWGQTSFPQIIEGQLLDAQNNEVIRFAKIYNQTIRKGTLSDGDGYFNIEVSSDTDVVVLSYIGYQAQNLLYAVDGQSKVYYLNQKIQLIDEVIISPRDLPYLYELIYACKLKASFQKSQGKAVYELKSFMGEDQIELVEGYYNFNSRGYDLEGISLKTARLGVQLKNGKMFISTESSRAIVMQNLLTENEYFPHSPFEFNVRKMKQNFSLVLGKKYLDENKDSIYVIDYFPRNEKSNFYQGTLWLNKTKSNIVKVESNCVDCRRHPFLPLFPTDTIVKLDLYITRTFQEVNGQMAFNHVDFKYDVQYKSRSMTKDEVDYQVKTQAVLYAYDRDQLFHLPHFSFEDPNIGDYRKVNAIPYDSFFWEYNDEDRLTDRKDRNKKFMEDEKTIESRTLFAPNAFYKKGLLEHPYKLWSTNRFFFRVPQKPYSVSTAPRVSSGVGYVGPLYQFKVRVFADINTYNDSTNIITATVFDPYESYSRLPSDAPSHCFINMYFDMYEIARRKFLEEFKKQNVPNSAYDTFYEQFFAQVEEDIKLFCKEVERGQNKEKMKKWNTFILQNLGIDNLDLFKPFETQEKHE